MKRRGFTLAELLATIVILGIITAITVPIVINQVDSYKKKMCVTQYDNILNAARAYASDHIQELSNSNTITLETLTKGGYIDGDNLKDVISEEKISPDLKIQIIKVGKKYKCYIVDNDAMGCGDEYKKLYDSSEPTAEIKVVSVGIDSITVKGICTDPDSGISKYEFSLDNVNWVSNKNKPLKDTYTFENLVPNTNYTLYVKCSNGMSAKTKGHTDKKTKELPLPTITVPEGWRESKTVTITTDNVYKIEYVKNNGTPVKVNTNTATVEFTENGTIKARVSSGKHYGKYVEKEVTQIDKIKPSCTISVTGGTKGSNNWYTTSPTIKMKTSKAGDSGLSYTGPTEQTTASYTKQVSSGNTGENQVTMTSDKTTKYYGYVKAGNGKTATCTSGEIKLDQTNPTAKAEVTPISTDKITVTARCSSPSGISKYEFRKDNGSWITSSTNTHTFTGLKPYNAYGQNTTSATHSFQVRCTSGAGKKVESELVNEQSKPYIPPTYDYNDSTDSTGKLAGTNWRQSKIYHLTFNGANVTTPIYYFYTTVPVTSSVSVRACGLNYILQSNGGSGTIPKGPDTTCSGDYTSNIQPNTWYMISPSSHGGYQYPNLTFKQPGQIVSRINDGTSYYQSSSNDIEFITGTSINDYEKNSMIVHLDGLTNTDANTWTNLTNNTKASVSTTSGWQNGQKVCGAYDPNRGCLMWTTENGSLYFDGVDDYLDLGIHNNTTLTIETVSKPSRNSYMINNVNAGGYQLDTDGVWANYNGNYLGYSSKLSSFKQMTYYATTIKPGEIRYYRDVENTSSSNRVNNYLIGLGGNGTITYSYPNVPLTVGCKASGCGTGNYEGYIYAVRFHNGILDQNQISKNNYIDRIRYGF